MNAKVAYNKEDRIQEKICAGTRTAPGKDMPKNKNSPRKRYAQKQEQPPEKSEGCKKGCDVGLEPTTPRTTIWCSTN